MDAPKLSIVVPVHNEEQSLPVLYAEVRAALESGRPEPMSFELILVDDHSTDRSREVMLALRARDRRVRVICFGRNFGQTAAMSAGFEQARGRVVVTLDGDLQNDPADIPRVVACLEEGYDVVAGWRRKRYDGLFLRRVPSLIANRLINLVTGTRIHDTGCTLKAFRREVVEHMPLYAEQHRFLAAMSQGSGARVLEVVVNHRPRRFGASKYGIGRALRVLLDLLTIKMIAQFSHRPLHYFVLFALPVGAGGFLFLFMGLVDWERMALVEEWKRLGGFVCALLFLTALDFILLGLLGELAVSASGMHRRGVLHRLVTQEKRP